VWNFIKNTAYFLLGLALVPVAWYLLAIGCTAILERLNPALQYNWNQFSSNGKLLVLAAVDIAFAVAVFKMLWTERRFLAIGVLCSAVVDFAVRALR